jgi:hypothetical protein
MRDHSSGDVRSIRAVAEHVEGEPVKSKRTLVLIGAFFFMMAPYLNAQPVYKCQSKGSVVYSHEPCVGAQTVDTTPTQGLDKSSGKSRKGADVLKSEQHKAMAQALQPIFGESPEQYETRHRRFKLSPESRAECVRLDLQLASREAAVRDAKKDATSSAEAALFESRKRFRELRC